MVVLEHKQENCIGQWRLRDKEKSEVVSCDRCEAIYPATPENRLAAIDENYAGIYLRRLTAEGYNMLGGEEGFKQRRKKWK